MGIRWTEEEAIEHGFRKNQKGEWELSSFDDSRQMSKPKPSVQDQTERKDEIEKTREVKSEKSDRYIIVVTNYRKRDIDPDNLCPKWYIDEMVRAKLAFLGDTAKHIAFVGKRAIIDSKAEERTVIETAKIPDNFEELLWQMLHQT